MTEIQQADLEKLALDWLASHNRNPDVDPDQLQATTNLLETGILDSISFIDLLAFMEEQTQRQLELAELEPEEFSTIRGLCQHICQQKTESV